MSRAPYILSQPMQQAFTGGELSPLLWARPDQARYTTGARRMRNMVCIPQGAAMRRSGLRFLGKASAQSGPVRLIPFVFSLTQTRILELGGGYMRVWRGDTLLTHSNGTPYSIATPYSAEHVQDLRVTQIADVVYITHRGYRPRKLSRHADTDWRLQEISWVSFDLIRQRSLEKKGNLRFDGITQSTINRAPRPWRFPNAKLQPKRH